MDLALGFILQIFSLFSVLMSKYTIYNQHQQTLCCLNLKKIESDVGSNNSLTLIYSAHNSNQQNKDIGVLGAFFRVGQQFLSAKTQSCSAKKYPLRGGQILQFCSAKLMYHSFVSHCSASLNIGPKLLNDD